MCWAGVSRTWDMVTSSSVSDRWMSIRSSGDVLYGRNTSWSCLGHRAAVKTGPVSKIETSRGSLMLFRDAQCCRMEKNNRIWSTEGPWWRSLSHVNHEKKITVPCKHPIATKMVYLKSQPFCESMYEHSNKYSIHHRVIQWRDFVVRHDSRQAFLLGSCSPALYANEARTSTGGIFERRTQLMGRSHRSVLSRSTCIVQSCTNHYWLKSF